MIKAWNLCLLALLLSSSFHAIRADGDVVEDDEYADSERGFLIVRKFVKDEIVIQGRNVTVTVDIYNAGSRCVLVLVCYFVASRVSIGNMQCF